MRRGLEPPRLGGELPLEELQDPLVVPVGGDHVAVGHPRLVVAVVPEGAEHRRAEVEGQDLEALGRAGRRARQHRLELRGHLVDQRDARGRRRDPRIGVVGGRVGRRSRGTALPGQQRAEAVVLGQQEAERRRAGAGQTRARTAAAGSSCSSISGWRRYQSSTSRRTASRPIAWSRSTAIPSSLNDPAASAPSSSATSPSWNDSSPRSVRPVRDLASAITSSAPSIDPPVVVGGQAVALVIERRGSPAKLRRSANRTSGSGCGTR